MKKKLRRYELRFVRANKEDTDHWMLFSRNKRKPRRMWAIGYLDKNTAKKYAAEDARRRQPSQLIIFKKDGTFQEERTYPRSRDPKRSKG